MERNYDEIISEMLRSIDRHSEELTKQNARLEIQSVAMTRQSEKSDALWHEQRLVNARLFAQMDLLEQRLHEQKGVNHQNVELALHTAAILDRIIKKNELKL